MVALERGSERVVRLLLGGSEARGSLGSKALSDMWLFDVVNGYSSAAR